MKAFLRKLGKHGKRLVLAGVMTPAMTACGHTIDPTMAQLPVYDMPAAVVVKTPPARMNGGALPQPGMVSAAPMPMAPPVMGGPVAGPNMVPVGDGRFAMSQPGGATIIQQSPITVQHPSTIIPQPPVWVGNPPMPIPAPPVIINQPGFSYNQAEIVVHQPRVELVETVVLPTQVIAPQPVYTPPPEPAPPPPPAKPKETPPPPPPSIPKVEPTIPQEDVLPPK
ncbi:MAG: hypothetical protein HQL84_03740 [Magnetococcales bacterium]|nr:hypothetical protein [Magnetococcales bacterium]MBF0149137.1 hypothetical protein [Magnetococcales bacterium]MBF0173217.1 hypothetical protein [Magnetococcales bacterium]MBF0348924.1 hypothetical protein [Magnetococcales bacterium]MBF0632868.1 hypothetical protein [Magnetococcales bacterium]